MRVAAEFDAGALHTAVVHDPHLLWIDAVGALLESIGVNVVGRAAKADSALALLDEHVPELLITELQGGAGGSMSGLELIHAARERVPGLRVIVLAASQEPADIARAFDAGAVVYVLKTALPDDVAAAIRQTFDRSVFLTPAHRDGCATATPAPAVLAQEGVGLTRREREILALVSEGHSNPTLAKMLWVTEQTVKFHLSNIYRKLGVANRTEAALWAHRNALVLAPAESLAV
jgi:DNA-binding NarL/FixJ family response regulator